MVLKTLLRDVTDKHIHVQSDNTIVVASITRCGSTKHHLMDVSEAIFEWAHNMNIALSAEYLLGSLNVTVGLPSHERDFNETGGLCLLVFNDICR